MLKKMRCLVFLLFFGLIGCSSPAQRALNIGDKVPPFILKDQEGRDFAVRDYIGKKILVIYFYPKDESTICTKESCAFRDHYADFEKAGAFVIGINYGSVESHKAFIQHHQLPFVLLSDPGNKVYDLFGVKKKWMITGRETFVIDKSGTIAFTFNSFTSGPEHSEKALAFVKQMPGGANNP